MNDREARGRSDRSKARPASEGAFGRLQTQGERLLHWFPDLGKTLLGEGDPTVESLLGQIHSLRAQMSRRAQETGREIEAKAERILADIEKQAVRGLKPLLTRANVASRTEIETLERRIAHLEGRLGSLLDDRARLSARVLELERQVEETRADLSERLHEIALRLSATDDARVELAAVRNHLDTISKDQVARSLDLSKLQDRVIRLEMRFGDFLKEQGTLVVDHEETRNRLAALGQGLDESARFARDLEPELRQMDIRIGDLTERQAATREDLAAFAARIEQLELDAARRAAPELAGERVEGH
jgi:predicted  nucleic acid-binding Zn-ribbon protein